MEYWLITFISTFILLSIYLTQSNKSPKLPPGPSSITLPWLLYFSELEPLLQRLRSKYRSLITLQIGFRPLIFITTRSLAHQALVQHGALFAERPPPLPITQITSSNQHTISLSPYGPTWRLLRRNLTTQILHPSHLKSYANSRKSVLEILITSLSSQPEHAVVVKDHLQYSMFCLLTFMCFGDHLEQDKIREVERVERAMLTSVNRFNVLNFWPKVARLMFYKRWCEFLQLRRDQEEVLIPLIRARERAREREGDAQVLSYVDTLIDLELPEEKRKLEEKEIVSLCSEFLDAGTDTTSTALEWILANLVKYPGAQEKLLEEIRGVVGAEAEEVKEEDLERMPYLKAVILEGLRRHPPGHFLVPHGVTEDIVLQDFVIPKDAIVNCMVGEMGWDPEVWEDPMAFKPERFLNGDCKVDVTGRKEIKMMPFGVGRRMCPAYKLAMMHLEYFVANLIWRLEWRAAEGDDVDLSEKLEFTVVMRNPLKAHITPRATHGHRQSQPLNSIAPRLQTVPFMVGSRKKSPERLATGLGIGPDNLFLLSLLVNWEFVPKTGCLRGPESGALEVFQSLLGLDQITGFSAVASLFPSISNLQDE